MAQPGFKAAGRFWSICAFLVIFVFAPIVNSVNEDLKIYSLHIKSDIKLRYATTLITSRVVNGNLEADREVEFDVTLPNQAMITNFSMEIDGKIYPGELKEKKAAQKQYDAAKKKGQSAGQIKARPRETNKFSVQVNVAAQGKVTFNLTYQELLARKKGLYEHIIYIDPGQPVDDMRVDIAISESRPITRLSVPPISNELLTNNIDLSEENDIAVINRPTPKSAFIHFRPSRTKQQEMGDAGISGLFRTFYDVERSETGGEVLVVNGYFVHFFAPEGLDPVGKNVLFILDVSSSMTGKKMQQLKEAMKSILNDLSEGDKFAIAKFSTAVTMWKAGFVPVNDENIALATQHVNTMRASGWTNINAALLSGIQELKDLDDDRAGIIVFLTDGEPTKGETNPDRLLKNVRSANEGAQLFSLAFGDGADYDFVKKVAAQNYGVARKIYEDSDAALQISGFYEDISTALMQDVTFKYVGDQVDNSTLTNSKVKSYFQGSEFIISGKLQDPDVKSLTTEITGISSEGGISLILDSGVTDIHIDDDVVGLTKLEDLASITERIWGYLSIKQLEKRLLLDITTEERDAIEQHILEKALKFHFVTPYTSMVVTKPDASELSDVGDSPTPSARDKQVTRRPPVYSSGPSSAGGGDPHFEVWLPGVVEPFCFDVDTKPRHTYTLLEDKKRGLTITAKIVGGVKFNKRDEQKTYIQEIGVSYKKKQLTVLPTLFGSGDVWNFWQDKTIGKIRIKVLGNQTALDIHVANKVKLHIRRFVHANRHVDYLNFVVTDGRGLSKKTDGLIGQFVHKSAKLRKQRRMKKTGMTRGTFVLFSKQGKMKFKADLKLKKKDVAHQTPESCWMIHKPEKHFIERTVESYRIPS